MYHSKDIGDGALVFDTIWSGAQDWQELRVINRNIPEIAEAIRVEYDLYYLLEASNLEGGVRPYAVGNPGWVKLGVDANNANIIDLPVETINGKDYAVQHVVIPATGTSGCSELYVGSIGSLQVYEGPVYMDNLVIITEEYVD